MRHSYRVLRHRYGLPPYYFDINSWLDAQAALPSCGGLAHLECADTAEIYSDVFGRENVHVVPYELLNRDADSFVCEIARIAVIDVDNAIELCHGQSADHCAPGPGIVQPGFSRMPARYALRCFS